ncbi:hypothetical protein CAL7716_100510 (plasmid) [Calothrix sp. PCC 7716]|nr:hypothetical protein CAL7716_100510 [Calothrix sp. PCC 7716]
MSTVYTAADAVKTCTNSRYLNILCKEGVPFIPNNSTIYIPTLVMNNRFQVAGEFLKEKTTWFFAGAISVVIIQTLVLPANTMARLENQSNQIKCNLVMGGTWDNGICDSRVK